MTYKKSKIALSQTRQFSKLLIDYICADNSLRKFYAYEPKIEAFEKAIHHKSKETVNRKVLVEVLKEQYKRSNIQAPASVELLLNENTFTVCTGHQLCLFTGPLYFIYKIISTINLAEKLKKQYPENNIIPVYWMATEDHDFEEIKSIHLFGKKISWENIEARGAVGRLSTQTLNLVLEEIKQLLGSSENADKLADLFTKAYSDHKNMADATRYFVHQLFSEHGLVIIDPDDKKLKSEFVEIIKDDIFNNTNHQLVSATVAELEKTGVKPQVNPREINCFYLLDNIRERIENDGNRYSVLNTNITFTKEELQTEIELHPDRFSPNVVLRPVYQQKILPNIAYVGGPGEIAYWLEYKTMFEHHKIMFPVLIPRNFATITDEKSMNQISKLGFTVNDIFEDTDVLIKKFINKNANTGLSLKEQEDKLVKVFDEISEKATAIDSTLKSTVEAEMQKSVNAIKNIENKLMRAEKQKQETSVNQIKKIKEKYLPEGILQERYDNFIPFYLKSGKQFISGLKEAFDPFEFEMILLEM
ncbi:MAG: bacillithiol biosynthesis cysteine-adding enzyme BshC [Bacteroidia bacterium]